MSTPLTTAIQSLTTYANETTGASDATLSAAVATLASGYGGGGSSWTHIYSTEIAVSTTDTGIRNYGRYDTGNTNICTTPQIVMVRFRDKAGRRAGYYYGADTVFYRSVINGANVVNFINITMCCKENGGMQIEGSSYGLWCSSISDTGELNIFTRYSSTKTLTMDGTFTVDVYILEGPNGVAPIV